MQDPIEADCHEVKGDLLETADFFFSKKGKHGYF